MKRLSVVFLTLVGLIAWAPASAHATTDQLDQQYTAPPNTSADISNTGYQWAQTYTAGINGTLDRVVLNLSYNSATYPTQPLNVAIYPATQTAPVGNTPLSTTSITPQVSIGYCTWVSVPLNRGVQQVAGSHYAIVLSSSSPSPWGWCGTSADGYPFGQADYASAQRTDRPTAWYPGCPDICDLNFQTYVVSAGVSAV